MSSLPARANAEWKSQLDHKSGREQGSCGAIDVNHCSMLLRIPARLQRVYLICRLRAGLRRNDGYLWRRDMCPELTNKLTLPSCLPAYLPMEFKMDYGQAGGLGARRSKHSGATNHICHSCTFLAGTHGTCLRFTCGPLTGTLRGDKPYLSFLPTCPLTIEILNASRQAGVFLAGTHGTQSRFTCGLLTETLLPAVG